MISLSLISRARLCVPRFPPTSLAFIDSPLIRLEGEVRSNGINDGVHALLAAACDGKVTGRDHCPGLAKPAPSIGAGLGDGDLPCHWDPCIKPWHPGTHLFHRPRAGDRDPANPRLPPAPPSLRRLSNQTGRPLQIGYGHGQQRSGPRWVLLRACTRPRLVSAANEGSEHPPPPASAAGGQDDEEVSGGVPVSFPIAASLTPSASSSPVPPRFITPPAPTSTELLQHQSRGEDAPHPATLPPPWGTASCKMQQFRLCLQLPRPAYSCCPPNRCDGQTGPAAIAHRRAARRSARALNSISAALNAPWGLAGGNPTNSA